MITITVQGEPIPKARARHSTRKTKTGKTIVQTYTPDSTVVYERRIAGAAFLEMNKTGAKMIAGPCRLELEFCFKAPESWPAWKKGAAIDQGICHTSKPDLDNLIKSVCDGLNGITWLDDAQVMSITASKRYSSTPGVKIWIVDSGKPGSQVKNKTDLGATA